jgi:hypothetical protein
MVILTRSAKWFGTFKKVAVKPAPVVEAKEPILPAHYYICPDCHNSTGVADFHDCKGIYDEMRLLNHNASNLVRRRLQHKYGTEYESKALEYIAELGNRKFNELKKQYEEKLAKAQLVDPILMLEEQLWQS